MSLVCGHRCWREARAECCSILSIAEGAQTPALLPFPDLTAPEVAYPAYAQPGVDPATIAHMSGVYLENLDMPELIEKVRAAASLAPPKSTLTPRLAKHVCLSCATAGLPAYVPRAIWASGPCVSARLLAHISLCTT